MKPILSSRRRHYLARVSIFLVAAALIAGMVVGCGSGEDVVPFESNPMVSAGAYHTVGLDTDGTVVAVGPDGGTGWPY